MWNAVPIEDLLLLLCSNAVVLVHEVEERTLWLLEGRVCSRLQIAKVGENALLELLRVLDRPSECLESEGEASHDICAGDVEEIVPCPC